MPKTLNEEFQEFVDEIFGPLDPECDQYRDLKMTFFGGVATGMEHSASRMAPLITEVGQYAAELASRVPKGSVQ